MAYYGEPGPAEWMQITCALRQKEMEVLALRERLAEAETRYTYAAPVEEVPFEVQMIHGRLADAEAQHAAYAASVHGMTFGVTAPVPPPVPSVPPLPPVVDNLLGVIISILHSNAIS